MEKIDKKNEMVDRTNSDYVRIVNNTEEEKKARIEKVRKYLRRRLFNFDGIIKLDDFTTEELEEILFNHCAYDKSFALPMETLQKIDMSNVSFENFRAHRVDFSKLTGVVIEPSKLAGKACCDVNFSGVKFLGEFSSVFLEGCKFGGSVNAVIGDDVRYGGVNDFTDVTFKSPITYGVLNGSNFAGSKGAVIELGEEKVKLIIDCCFKDATLKGNLIGCIIQGTDFRGANIDNGKIELYPDKLGVGSIYESDVIDFSDCHFAGVKFMRPIGGKNVYKIKGADFTGSEGVIIHPSVISKYDYSNCKLAGVSFIPGTSISDANLNGTDFTGSVGVVISSSQRSIVDANLTDASVKFIDPDDFFAIPGINSATYNGKKFKTVFKETISKDFDDPIKTYTKKINAAIVKASE